MKPTLKFLLIICALLIQPVWADTKPLDLELTSEESTNLRKLADETEIYFFFRGDCGYCHKLAPGLKKFAAQYHFKVVPVSLDGGGIPGYPHPQADDGAAEYWQVVGVPSVYMVNHDTKNVYPIAYGMVSIQQLANRLLMVKE